MGNAPTNTLPRDASQTTAIRLDNPGFPRVGKLVLAVVQNGGGRNANSLSMAQIEDLFRPIVSKYGDVEMSLDGLYEQYGQTFENWAHTLPTWIKKHGQQVTAGTVIRHMLGYDHRGYGFREYLLSKNQRPAEKTSKQEAFSWLPKGSCEDGKDRYRGPDG